MQILIVPDSFKESLSAPKVAQAIARGLKRSLPQAKLVQLPIADGGEGSVTALASATTAQIKTFYSQDPLHRKIQANIAWQKKTCTAIIETAASSGLHHLRPQERNPLCTSSFGTGLEILHALNLGSKKIILCLGGVGTNDAGSGMAQALGFKLLDKNDKLISDGAQGLLQLHRIDSSKVDPRLKQTEFVAASDVTNPLCGANGSAAVYGPQKGATPAMVKIIDRALNHFAKIVQRDLGKKVLTVAGSGAAGALGAGSIAFLNAQIVSGTKLIFDLCHLEEKIKQADWIIAAEGQADFQTTCGKAAMGIAALAKKHKKPVILFCGNIGNGAEKLKKLGIDAIFSIAPGPISLQQSMKDSAVLLDRLATQVGALLRQKL